MLLVELGAGLDGFAGDAGLEQIGGELALAVGPPVQSGLEIQLEMVAGGAGDGRDAVVWVEPFPLRLQRIPFHAADPIEAKTVHMVFFQPEAHHILHVGQGVG